MSNPYSFMSQIKSSPFKKQGFINIIASCVLGIFVMLVLNQSGLFSETADVSSRHSMLIGAMTGGLLCAAVPLGFISVFWGRLALFITMINTASFAFIYYTGQSDILLGQEGASSILLTIWISEAFFLFAVTYVIRDQHMRRLAETDDYNARAAHADLLLQPIMFNRWLVGSRFADFMQNQTMRRVVTLAFIASLLIVCGYFCAAYNARLASPEGITDGLTIIERLEAAYGSGAKWLAWLLLMLPAILITLFQMGLRPLMALDLNPLDERQVQVIRYAHADGRLVSLWALAFITVIAILGFDVPIIAGTAFTALILAWLTPYFIMSWNLGDEEEHNLDDEELCYGG